MKTIVAAAIERYDGTIYSLPPPARHHNVIKMMASEGLPLPIEGIQGFVTSEGMFVGRRRAAEIAVAAGQIREPRWPPDLYSEDLW